MTIYHRDQCPEAIEYLWKVEILNNWQKYWDPMNRSLHLDQEIHFNDEFLKKAVFNII
jgi:hypothetical protein